MAPHCLLNKTEDIGKAKISIIKKEMIEKIERKELLHIVTKLHSLFSASMLRPIIGQHGMDLELAIKIVGAIDRWVTCEGGPGLKRAKTMSNVFIRHLMGTPLELIPLSNQYKRLIHKALLNCNNTSSKIYWVSVFSSFRLYRLKPDYDVSSITDSFRGRLTGLLRLKYLGNLGKVNQSFRSAMPDQNWRAKWKWHISGASGPNGSPAYSQYLNDLRALSYTWLGVGCLILYLALPFDNKWKTLKAFRDVLVDALNQGDNNAIHSRLTFLRDKGGKTRVVALGDILSQSLLKLVHQRCNLILRRLTQDGTFDQDRSRSFVRKMSEDNVFLASIDLTAATDRMPVLYQVFVIISLRILTPLQAFGWWWVTTKRDFTYTVDGERKYVRYKVGQPMGLLSSWPVMAISHHYLVRLAFAASGFKRLERARYSVLGDDLTLQGKRVAGEYLNLIQYLGMEYSPEKTYLARGRAEFAKSLFVLGEDLTPFPLPLFRFNKNTVVSNVLAIVTECKRKKLPLTAATLTGLHPRRWRNLVLLAALSPTSPRYALDLPSRDDQWIFLQFILTQRIKYFARHKTVRDSIVAFALEDPSNSAMLRMSPYMQIVSDNSESYPVRYLKDITKLMNPEILLGSGWISYCTKSWPDGIPSLGDRKLIPGPNWKKEVDDLIVRSSLLKLNKLLPDYFVVRCVGKQVGE